MGSKVHGDILLDDPQSEVCASRGIPFESGGPDDEGGFRRLPVVEGNNRLVGMISERDVRQHLGHLAETRVNAPMASNPMAISEFDMVEDAAELMLQHKIGGFP